MDMVDLGEAVITDYWCTLADCSHFDVTSFGGMEVNCPLMYERNLAVASPYEAPERGINVWHPIAGTGLVRNSA